MNVFCKNNYLHVVFSDGSQFSTDENIDELWQFINENKSDERIIKNKLCPTSTLVDRVKASTILTLRGNSVYMLEVSELSIPSDFVEKILNAEESGDITEINKYKNFWTLVSMNPDSRVRDNIFWFIRKWDMKITESGFIIAYRNADIKDETTYSTQQAKEIINRYYQEKYLNHKDPYTIYGVDGGINETSLGEMYDDIVNGGCSPVYTDHHSHTTTIKLGQPVRMPREETDQCQENTCSRGLHVAGTQWLKQNYFGSVGMMVLVNPANVVAVPTGSDNYGKMRTCEYFPVALIDFDSEGNIIEPEYNLYNDIAYLNEIKYEGTINNVDVDNYVIARGQVSRETMYDSILERLNQQESDSTI